MSLMVQGHEPHHSLNILEQNEGLVRSQCHAPGELGGVLLHGCNMDQPDSKGKWSKGALREAKVDRGDYSIGRGELGG